MADETRIQVLKEPDREAETDSYMWLFRTGEDGLFPTYYIQIYGNPRKIQRGKIPERVSEVP